MEAKCSHMFLDKKQCFSSWQSHLHFCKQHVPPSLFQKSVGPFQDLALVHFLHRARERGILDFCGTRRGFVHDWQAFRVVLERKKAFERRLLVLFGMQDADGNRACMDIYSDAWQTAQESFWHLGYVPDAAACSCHAVWAMAFGGELDFVFRLKIIDG